MNKTAPKFFKVAFVVLVLGTVYLLSLHKHAQRDDIRKAAVKLTPNCAQKLGRYGLAVADRYESPYALQRTGTAVLRRGYSDDDVRDAIAALRRVHARLTGGAA